MRYKKFGNTGLDISAISIGTYAVGNAAWGQVDKQAYVDAIEKMIELGCNHVDTAINYGKGASETILGSFIKKYRDKLYVTSKGCFRMDEATGKQIRDASYENMVRSCDISLERLGLDYLDFYLVHQPDETHPISETMSALNDLQKAGKVKYIGVSNYSLDMLKEARKYADVRAIQSQFSMVSRSNQELMEYCLENGIGVMSTGSLGAGILTGVYRTCPNFGPDDARTFAYDYFVEPKFSRIMELLKVMDEISAQHNNCPLAHIAINWQTQKDFISTALCGVNSVDQAIENCAGLEWSLSDEEIKKLDDAIAANNI